MRKHFKSYLFSFFSLAALLICLPGASVGFAKAQTPLASHYKDSPLACRGLSIVPSANVGTDFNDLYGVTAVSTNDVWAVGDYLGSIGADETLIEHWNGWNWSVVPSPNGGMQYNILLGVSALSANNVWAVGDDVTSSNIQQTLIERWNGTNWSVVPSPSFGSVTNVLYSVAAISANNVWAVGLYQNSGGISQTLIEHWNGTNWNVAPSPSVGSYNNGLSGVAAVSASDIWAVGDYSNSTISTEQTLIEHWNGTDWSVVSDPNVGSGPDQLYSLAALSTDNVWAVGYRFNGIPSTLVEHWNGTSWSVVSSQNTGDGDSLRGVTGVSASNFWAVGTYSNISSPGQTLIEHWNGTNWSFVGSINVGSGSNELIGVAAVPGSSTVWAVGDHTASSNDTDRTLIERFC